MSDNAPAEGNVAALPTAAEVNSGAGRRKAFKNDTVPKVSVKAIPRTYLSVNHLARRKP